MTWLDGWRALWRVVWLLLTSDSKGEEVRYMRIDELDTLRFKSGIARQNGTALLYKQVGDLFFVCEIPQVGQIGYAVFHSERDLFDYVTSRNQQAA